MMFKTLIFILLTLGFKMAEGAVSARWLTVSSVALEDGKNTILFDAAWTRPGLLHWLGVNPLKSDEKLVSAILAKNNLNKIDAVFSSHSHFDHVMDLPVVSKLTGAVFYGDKSSERIVKAYKDPSMKVQIIKAGEKIKVGDFTITPILRQHPKILHLVDFLPGEVPEDCNLNFWDYHVGDTWFYIIEHPEGNVILDQGSESYTAEVQKIIQKADVLLQGVANRRSDEAIVEGYAKAFKPKFFMPLHFDNFFADFNEGAESELPMIRLENVLEKLKKAYPTMKADRPRYGEKVVILEVKR